eukprot:gene6300-4533_t
MIFHNSEIKSFSSNNIYIYIIIFILINMLNCSNELISYCSLNRNCSIRNKNKKSISLLFHTRYYHSKFISSIKLFRIYDAHHDNETCSGKINVTTVAELLFHGFYIYFFVRCSTCNPGKPQTEKEGLSIK